MKKLVARDVMNRQVLTVRPDMTVHELAGYLTENQISGAPVVDEGGKLLGLVSLTDIAESDGLRADLQTDDGQDQRAASGWKGKVNREDIRGLRLQQTDLLVGDIMTPAAYTVPEDTPVSRLAQTMIAGRIHRLLVTHGHEMVGIVTSLDLLKLLCAPTAAEISRRGRSVVVR